MMPASHFQERTMSEMRTVKDLAIGDVIQVDGFDGNLTVQSARRIRWAWIQAT
jgi:hypothetical protein